MMKRSMDTAGGPDPKKARWSPNSFGVTNGGNGGNSRDAFANYGYGPQSSLSQGQFNGTPNGFGGALYSTPSLSINTNTGGNAGLPSQLSPNPGTSFAQQAQTPLSANANSPYLGFGYNMLGMGLPAMNVLGTMGGFPYGNQMNNFQAQYSPASLQVALGTPNNVTSRTVYVGNLPATASVDELLNLVHFGPLESIRVLPEKSCVFLSFLDGPTAAQFYADAVVKKLSLHGQELKIGWGKQSPVPSQVTLAIQQSNASRNVYLGGLDENTTEEQLRDDLSRFGLIDQVKIVRDKNIGFVHFLSISVATKVVNTLPTEPSWAGKRVNYGKDRCAYVPKSQQAAAQAAQAAAAQSLVAQTSLSPMHQGQGTFGSPMTPYLSFAPDLGGMSNMNNLGGLNGNQALNRTIYLGNIHPETTTEDLCNAIRGGVLQSIRYMQDKHIAFVTFVDPAAAMTFYQVASLQGLTLNNRRLKVGWGKNSGPLPPTLALSVHSGATRNVYIGNIEDFEAFSEERLKRDFGEYGDIELVNFLKEKNCAFVNYTNIANAIKAIEAIKTKPDYANLRIAHGKDRCANPPRSGPQASGMKRTASGNTAVGVADGLDGDNGLGLTVNVSDDTLGIEDGGEEVLDVNA
jgi:RNA recognition motif-containing protein